MTDEALALRVPAEALPTLIDAHDHAANQLDAVLHDLRSSGRINTPWTGDPVAADITARFNRYAVDGNEDGTPSAYSCLRGYQQELQRVADTMRQLHAAYQAGEATTAAAFRTA